MTRLELYIPFFSASMKVFRLSSLSAKNMPGPMPIHPLRINSRSQGSVFSIIHDADFGEGRVHAN